MTAPPGPLRSPTPIETSFKSSSSARTTIWNDSVSPRAASRMAALPLAAAALRSTRTSDGKDQTAGFAAAGRAMTSAASPANTVPRPLRPAARSSPDSTRRLLAAPLPTAISWQGGTDGRLPPRIDGSMSDIAGTLTTSRPLARGEFSQQDGRIVPPVPPRPTVPLPLWRTLLQLRRNAIGTWGDPAYELPILSGTF